jgi:hypothetical protein
VKRKTRLMEPLKKKDGADRAAKGDEDDADEEDEAGRATEDDGVDGDADDHDDDGDVDGETRCTSRALCGWCTIWLVPYMAGALSGWCTIWGVLCVQCVRCYLGLSREGV